MRTYDITKHSHAITYAVESRKENQFMLDPDTTWMLTAECSECGWLHHQTITNRGENPFTEHHRDSALSQHHLGIGMFVVPKTEGIGNHLFIREADNSYWRLTYNNGNWERTEVLPPPYSD